ncbi:MAG TPA: adenylate/guanylate cyclase domain-containing protein [Gaiellaceae bacterium]|nr:adenylate/guanylate cyclase domain-containing protein [Gaiellaceae bacterium]
MEPDIRYARNGDVAIAYQVIGSGEHDLVFVPGFVSNLVYGWESPYWREFYERLARSFRLILFDKRGTGLSDRGGAGWAALETRMEDMRTVLETVGSERAVVVGSHEGGQMAALYAATYPEATEALVLFQFFSHGQGSDSPYWQEASRALRDWVTQEYADRLLAEICPTLLRSEADRIWFANWLRVGASPEIGYALNMMFADSDVRDVLPTIRVPTLVLVRGQIAKEGGSEAAVELLPAGRLVEVAGSDYWGIFLSPEIVDEIETFVATSGSGRQTDTDTVLATVLFTDLVGSTARAAELGDRRWREVLAEHHARTRRELARHRGVELDTAGDGFFARFDAPARAIRCACAIRDSVAELGLELRAGLHTGECEILEDKVTGIAVSIGARVAAEAGAGEVLVSQTVRDLVAGSGLEFDDRGVAALRGVPGDWRLFAVRPVAEAR